MTRRVSLLVASGDGHRVAELPQWLAKLLWRAFPHGLVFRFDDVYREERRAQRKLRKQWHAEDMRTWLANDLTWDETVRKSAARRQDKNWRFRRDLEFRKSVQERKGRGW